MQKLSGLRVPKGFYWGAATASYQVEGGIENCDWALAAREGRVPACGRACDHYNRYEADFDIAKELGHNAHRFSIEWARIEPEEGKWNHQEIEHYRKVIQALKARGLRPYTTLWHFTLPLWFSQTGGFERSDSPEVFARYAKFIAEHLGDEIDSLTTMNEPIVYAGIGWLKGNWPPFKRFSLGPGLATTNSGDVERARPTVSAFSIFTYRKVVKNLAQSHNLAYQEIKSIKPHLDVSLVKHVVAFDSDWNPFNMLRAWFTDNFLNHSFLRKVYKHCDSIGLNYYHYVKFGNRPHYKKTDMDWEMVPEGIYYALKTLSKYKKPVFVSEAGLADHDDSDRAEYITMQVEGTLRALADGVDVRGHMYWSLLDNYEWALGFEKRFGLVEINYDTLERKIRPSAWEYKKLIERYSANEDNQDEKSVQ